MNRIVDLHQFIVNNGDKTFYETFFKLNFADLIFSDAVIFYEGDAERMYFESLINRKYSKYINLTRQYISYCQCGGAHAHKYFPLLNELRMVACVFTDIDYDKEREELEGIDSDKSSNATLNSILSGENKNIGSIYQQQRENRRKNIEVFTQTCNDGYSRTLEEAILYKLLFPIPPYSEVNRRKYRSRMITAFVNVKRVKRKIKSRKYNQANMNRNRGVFIKYSKEFWKNLKSESKLVFSIPNKKGLSITIRDVVNSLGKTNFMYSIIMNGKEVELQPNYIEEGLSWLNNKITSTK